MLLVILWFKVVRKTRIRQKQIGTQYCTIDAITWRQRHAAMGEKRKLDAEDGAVAKAKRAKVAGKTPYLASQDAAMALNSALEDSLGHGLEIYKCTKEREFEDDFEEHEVDEDCTLMITCDEVQYQLRMVWFLQRGLWLNVERFQPPAHRRNNDSINALVRAGLYWVFNFTILQRNLAYGAYDTGSNYFELWESALELLECLEPDDPFLLRLWPRICVANDWAGEQTNRAARQRFIAEIPNRRPFVRKGPRAAPSKWASLFTSLAYERRDADVKLLGLTFLGVNKGWFSSWEDIYSTTKTLSEKKMIALEHFACPSDVGSGAAASSGVVALPKAKAKGKAKAAAAKPPSDAEKVRISKAKAKATAAQKKRHIIQQVSKRHACSCKTARERGVQGPARDDYVGWRWRPRRAFVVSEVNEDATMVLRLLHRHGLWEGAHRLWHCCELPLRLAWLAQSEKRHH